MNSVRILVTGGAGFVGKHLVKKLTVDHEVTVLDNFFIGDRIGFLGNVNLVNGDILDAKLVNDISDVDVIYHLAGVLGTHELFDNIMVAEDVNVKGTLIMLEVARKYGAKFIFPSKPNIWLDPYTITKEAAERWTQLYHKWFGVSTIIMKWFNLYGPGQRSSPVQKVVPTFIEKALRNRPLPVFGDGMQTMDLTYIDDIVEASFKAMTVERAVGETILIGTGVETTVNELAELVIDLTDSKSEIEHLPLRRGETPRTRICADTTKTKKILNFTARNNLEQGLSKTIRWWQNIHSKVC